MKNKEKKELYNRISNKFKVRSFNGKYCVVNEISTIIKTGMLWWKKEEKLYRWVYLDKTGEKCSDYNNQGEIKQNVFIKPKYYKSYEKAKKAAQRFSRNELMRYLVINKANFKEICS
jgi:hypothetical protein